MFTHLTLSFEEIITYRFRYYTLPVFFHKHISKNVIRFIVLRPLMCTGFMVAGEKENGNM